MNFTIEQTLDEGNHLDVNWDEVSIEEFQMGLNHEYNEHFTGKNSIKDYVLKDAIRTVVSLMVLTHLEEDPCYYTNLEYMEDYDEEEDDEED